MLNSMLSPWPSFSEEEAKRVHDVILSNRVNYWTGDECRAFEREFAAWAGSAHAVAVNNGTLALDLALKALRIGMGDEVIVSPRTFLASVSCVVNAGATPVFVDVDRESGNISPETIAEGISPRTRAIIPVHLGGWPCEMPEIMALAKSHGIHVVEDCAQAHGAAIEGRGVGTWGDVGAWSFCQDKIMTTGGEGGMVTTDSLDLWNQMWSFKDHGKSWEAVYERQHAPGFRWLHEQFGTNWRMLEVQASIGRYQLGRVAEWVDRRRAIAQRIEEALRPFQTCLRVPVPRAGLRHAYYRQYGYVRPEGLGQGWSRDRIIAEITAEGVPVLHGSCSEVYLEKAFDGTPWRPAKPLSIAKELGETSIMFLTHPTITDEQLDIVLNTTADVLRRASR